MPAIRRPQLDSTDDAILELLQVDGRMSTADLARAVGMSSSSTADRVRRLTDEGVIRGYRAVVDPVALGFGVLAFVRLRLRSGTGRTFRELLRDTPQVQEAHHLTGEDCYLLRILARSMTDLEDIADRLTMFGHVTTNVVFSSPVDGRAVPPCS